MKQLKNLKKRCITLIEIMIVMFLIALITGVVAYNYRGSLDEGKKFKTQTGMDRLETVLNLHLAENPADIQHIDRWEDFVRSSPLVKDPNSLIYDGWGYRYQVQVDDQGNILVTSPKLEEYQTRSK